MRRSPRIGIIGNSYVGAAFRAWQLNPTFGSAAIDFHAAGGNNFQYIDVDDGRIVNARALAYPHCGNVGDYDAIFVYGTFPNPQELALLRRKLRKLAYSTQAIDLTVQDVMAASASHRLCRKLHAMYGGRVFVVSNNVPSNLAAIRPDDYERSLADIESFLRPVRYLRFPARLFGPDLLPLAEYYKDSVRITGAPPASEAQRKHDIYHMNPLGGEVMLRHIVETAENFVAGASPSCGPNAAGSMGGSQESRT